jgi:hypothetical protein
MYSFTVSRISPKKMFCVHGWKVVHHFFREFFAVFNTFDPRGRDIKRFFLFFSVCLLGRVGPNPHDWSKIERERKKFFGKTVFFLFASFTPTSFLGGHVNASKICFGIKRQKMYLQHLTIAALLGKVRNT